MIKPIHVIASAVFGITSLLGSPLSNAHGVSADAVVIEAARVPATLAVRKALPAPAKGIVDLKFGDIFKMPVGPLGMEPSEKLLALDGKRVRMVGFMVHGSAPGKTSFILAPVPSAISDEDEGQADDIPASAVLVDLGRNLPQAIPNLAGLIQVSGVLRIGAHEDAASQRVFAVRLELDKKPVQAIAKLAAKSSRAASNPQHAAP